MNKLPYILGLTGSIGMGKSTTSQMFKEAGIPVWDADAIVHDLYTGGTAVVQKVAQLVPNSVVNNDVDRDVLKKAIAADKSILQKLEAIVHPLVSDSRAQFIEKAVENHEKIVVVDHPLLFESGSSHTCDGVLVVSVNATEQRRRVLDRGTMDEATLNIILSKQMPDQEKRSRADFIIETTTLDAAQAGVQDVIRQIRLKHA